MARTSNDFQALARALRNDSPIYPFPSTAPTIVISEAEYGELEVSNNGDSFTVAVNEFGSAIIDELNAEFGDDEDMDAKVEASLDEAFSRYGI